jgi:hypothetical protein
MGALLDIKDTGQRTTLTAALFEKNGGGPLSQLKWIALRSSKPLLFAF